MSQQNRSFASLAYRCLPGIGLGAFIVAGYCIARFFVLLHVVNIYRSCTGYQDAWYPNCTNATYEAPTYLSLHGESLGIWMQYLAPVYLFLLVTVALGAIIHFLTTNGQSGRPFYSLIHMSSITDEPGWFGRRKRAHDFHIYRD